MSVIHDNPGFTLRATAAIPKNRLVTLAGALCAANATDDMVGVSTDSAAIGELVPVRFRTAGTLRCTAAVAITAGAIVYKAADGKVGVTDTNAKVGIALEAASGDDIEIAILPFVG